MIYKRRYLQFNELVLDSYDMLNESPHSIEFKVSSEEYGFGHGSYSPNKRNYPFAREQEVSLSITLSMKKILCEYRPFYKQFAIKEILRPGKLWAIVNNEILWAYAKVSSISEGDVGRDKYGIEVDFLLPEGVWHKADKLKTFLVPYDVCDFMDCMGYKETDPCKKFPLDGDCCGECQRKIEEVEDCCCCCDQLTQDMALCYHKDLQDLYKECTPSYKFEIDCRKGQEFFGDKYLGEKICTKDSCENIIAGRFYSNTEMPSESMVIVIDGNTHDPQITINGNKNIIKGDYDRLYIYPNGDVYSEAKNRCCKTLLDPSVWAIPTDKDEYGWTINQGTNRLVIDRGTCCGRACAYIQMDNLTI